MLNYETKIKEMRDELAKVENVVSIIEKIHRDMEWDTMTRVDDDSEDGYHYEAPSEDSWCYDKYLAYNEVLSILDKAFFKK